MLFQKNIIKKNLSMLPSENIKCGNSLISDPEVAGDKAFDWQKEFPQVFGAGGTQVSHLRTLADMMLTLNAQLLEKRNRFLRRLRENFEGVKITTVLQTFDELSFAAFVAELKKQKIKLSPKEQDQWEEYFDHYTAACRELTSKIESTDREIDLRVYHLYGLTYEEVKTVDPDTTITNEEYEQ